MKIFADQNSENRRNGVRRPGVWQKQDTPKEAPGRNGKSKYRILGRFLRKEEEILDEAWEEARKKEGLTDRPGPGSQIGAGKVKTQS